MLITRRTCSWRSHSETADNHRYPWVEKSINSDCCQLEHAVGKCCKSCAADSRRYCRRVCCCFLFWHSRRWRCHQPCWMCACMFAMLIPCFISSNGQQQQRSTTATVIRVGSGFPFCTSRFHFPFPHLLHKTYFPLSAKIDNVASLMCCLSIWLDLT